MYPARQRSHVQVFMVTQLLYSFCNSNTWNISGSNLNKVNLLVAKGEIWWCCLIRPAVLSQPLLLLSHLVLPRHLAQVAISYFKKWIVEWLLLLLCPIPKDEEYVLLETEDLLMPPFWPFFSGLALCTPTTNSTTQEHKKFWQCVASSYHKHLNWFMTVYVVTNLIWHMDQSGNSQFG